MKKATIRKEIIDKLKQLSMKEKLTIEKELRQQLFNSDNWIKAKSIGITMSQGFEWDTTSIIKHAWKEGKKVAVPKCLANKQMIFFQIDHFDQLEKGLYDIPEPIVEMTKELKKDEIDLLIVPGVVFSPNGYRIGFGGGYYDRFLVDFPNETISLASELQMKDRLPIDPFDMPVQFIITENKIYHSYLK